MLIEHNNAIAIPDRQSQYHTQLFEHALIEAFPTEHIVEARIAAHPDGSPIPIVGSANRVLLFSIYEGDNWQQVFSESNILADAFTASNLGLAPNANELGMFFVDLEGRRDRLDEKIVADSLHRAVVTEQGIPHRAFARSLYANGVRFTVGINDHSNNINRIYKEAGLIHIPLSTEAVLIRDLLDKEILTPELMQNLVLGTTDIGGLKEISTAKRYLDNTYDMNTPVAIIYKYHVPTGVDFLSEKVSEFAYGDVRDKFVLIIDDRSDSVESILQAVSIYEAQGASGIGIYITHPVFAKEEYYNNIKRLLLNEKVLFISASNSLPMDKYRISRQGGVKTPYALAEREGRRKKLELGTVNIHPFIIQSARTILECEDIQEAVQIFDENCQLLDMRDPYEIFQEITGMSLTKPTIIGSYENGEIYKFSPTPPLS